MTNLSEEEKKAIEYFDNTIKKLQKAREELQEMSNNTICKTIKNTIEFWQNKCFELQKELEQEKEKNASMKKEISLMKSININDNFISKDKIKDKIKEIKQDKDFDEDVYVEEFAVDVLEDLLKEN